MSTHVIIDRATADDAAQIATLVGALLHDIMNASGVPAFHFDVEETTARLTDFIRQGKYFVFVARDADRHAIGFVTLYESHALYAEGSFGTLPEFYVGPEYRSHGVGRRLLDQAKSIGRARGWKRLEVTTPPLPPFDRTLAFYEREGFAITGGRKLRLVL